MGCYSLLQGIVPTQGLNLCLLHCRHILHHLSHSLFKLLCSVWQILPAIMLASLHVCTCVHAQSCPTLRDPMDCRPPGFSVHGIFQARTLEWTAISFAWGSSPPRDWNRVPRVSFIGRWILYHWATWEALSPCTEFKKVWSQICGMDSL